MKKILILAFLVLSLNQANAQQTTKQVIFNSYYNLVDTLTSMKTFSQEIASSIKTWKDKSQKAIAEAKYVAIKSKVQGVIESFAVVIRNPTKKNISAAQPKIENQIKILNQLNIDFRDFYIKQSKVNSGKAFIDPIMVTTIISIGKELYTTIRGIVKSQREEKITEFKTNCSLLSWSEIGK